MDLCKNHMKILCIVGATGTGKNEFGLALAKKFGGEIVNFDSRQIYKGFPIITAQPDEQEKKLCRHHLYGFLEPVKKLSAGEFADYADKKIKEISDRGNIPILIGGTGLYLKALLFGLAPIPHIPQNIREQVIREYLRDGALASYEKLKKIDPEYSKKIHPMDKQRITRALEVYRFTKKNLTWYHKNYPKDEPRYNYLKIGIFYPKEELIARLESRINKMLEKGGVEEVAKAWEKNPDVNAPVWTSIGCRELLDYIQGKCSLEEAKYKWLKNTKKYAKRQMTWFKKENDINWYEYKELDKAIYEIESFLNE
ncbi:tRNA (adenosine(37)-N6)-dimethylallyltransferase MiaA [Desulfothermus naphthae]